MTHPLTPTGNKTMKNRRLPLDFQDGIYVPGTGRFAQPDNIIPNPANPQALNRYTYVLNSPIVFADPTGHSACYGADGYGQSCNSGPMQDGVWTAEEAGSGDSIYRDSHSDPQLVKFEKDKNHPQDWTIGEMYAVAEGARLTAEALAALYNSMVLSGPHVAEGIALSPSDAYLITYGSTVTAIRSSLIKGYAAEITKGVNRITYYNVQYTDDQGNPTSVDYDYTAGHVNHTIHELGHLFDNRSLNLFRGEMVGDLSIGPNEDFWKGFACEKNCPGRRYSRSKFGGEIFADMFMIWVTGNNFGSYESGDPLVNYSAIRQQHMQTNMPRYLFRAMMGP